MSNKELKSRSEMDPIYSWNLNDIISNQQEWDDLFSLVGKEVDEIASLSGTIMSSPEALYHCLNKKDELLIKFYRIYVFSNMTLHQDTNDSNSQTLVQKVGSLQVTVSSKLAFIEPEIMACDEDIIKSFVSENAALSLYSHYLNDMLRQKAHILPKEQEELLALAGDFASTPTNIFSMFMNADLVLPEVIDDDNNTIRLTHGNYLKLLKSSNVEVRKAAFEAMLTTVESNKNTLTSIYLSSLKKDVFETRARKFSTCCEASLYGNNIDVKVYDNLIQTVHEHLPLLHRYVALRKKMLGVSELHMYDLYTPMVKDMDEKINFADGKDLVLEALKPLGSEYLSIVEEGFSNEWIDVYENKGKRSGAYSWGTYGVHPYVLLNYQDTLNNTFTLAHEMGHAVHSYYSRDNQAFVNSSYPIFLAEVASTVNESLLIHHLLKTTTEKEKRIYLINHYMESFRTTLYRQVMFAEFERKSHDLVEKGEAVTSDVLNSIHLELNQQYYGNDIIVDDLVKYEWARIPHFYTSFYVYQYATGFSSAVTLSKDILEKGQPAVDKYKDFLKSGCSKYPLDTLEDAGVDMTTSAPVEKALKVFAGLLDEIELLIG
jgi:oligoendopeptidase F